MFELWFEFPLFEFVPTEGGSIFVVFAGMVGLAFVSVFVT